MVALLALAILAPEVTLGGHKEIIYGLKPGPPLILSHYIWIEEKPNEWGSSTNVYAQRLGFTGCQVKHDVFNNQRVMYFSTDGRTKRDYKKEADLGVSASEQSWIDPENGHIMKQVFLVEMPKTGVRVVEAVYGTKTVELTIKELGKERSLTLYPEEGCQPFFERFKPMIVDGKTIMREKKFAILDPVTLSYKQGSVIVGSRFEGSILLTKMRGNLFNFVIAGQRHRAYITDKQDLVKVEIADETYYQIDSLPSSMQPGGG